MANKTVKKVKTDFKVDLTDVKCGNDVYMAIVDAKTNKGLAITSNEFDIYIERIIFDTVKATLDMFTCCECRCAEKIKPAKKPNIFKRFWNWITRKK